MELYERAIATLSESQWPHALLLSILPKTFDFEKATCFLSLGKEEVSSDEVEDLLGDLVTSALAFNATSGAHCFLMLPKSLSRSALFLVRGYFKL